MRLTTTHGWPNDKGACDYHSKMCECNQQQGERQFEIDIRRTKGYEVKRMMEDGNCLFRAVVDQVYGDSEVYDLARQMCIDYMEEGFRLNRKKVSDWNYRGSKGYCRHDRIKHAFEYFEEGKGPFDALYRKWLRAAIFPLRLCISLNVFVCSTSVIAFTFEGLDRIPCLVMICP
ncbi:OTU domain-containing protein 5 [Tanacetum coccineum]|uniref:OTU domain-containing protein 5 n=1 Tax=Tanacetum coccineum TaxID=301880 RepID=A0ABQ5IYY2_9ASTR